MFGSADTDGGIIAYFARDCNLVVLKRFYLSLRRAGNIMVVVNSHPLFMQTMTRRRSPSMITRKEQHGHSIREFMRGGKKHVQFEDLSAQLPVPVVPA